MWHLSTSINIPLKPLTDGVGNRRPGLQSGCAQPYVAISTQAKLQERNKIIELTEELQNWISNQKLKIAGPLFHHYYLIGSKSRTYGMEIGFPVCTAVKGDEQIVAGTIPKGVFATLVHCGHPDNISLSLDVLQRWCRNQQLICQLNEEMRTDYFEFYLTYFANEPNPNKWRTAIAFLIE